MKPFFTYFGGKYRAAPHYPKPEHNVIVEPFAGAAGYSVRYFDRDIILYEKDPVVYATWKFLIDSSRKDILSLPLLNPSQSVDDFAISNAEKYLIGFWLNKGSASPCKKPSTWMKSGIRPNSFWGESIRSRIANQVELISHWHIVLDDYSATPNIRATWFIDPPYFDAGKNYKHGSKGIDYSCLAKYCERQSGQIIVCENQGATWLPFTSFKDIKASPASRGGKYSKEVIYLKNN